MARTVGGILSAGLVGLTLVAGCGTTLPLAEAPATPTPSQFMPGYRLEPGTTLRYQVRRSSSWTAAGQQMPQAREEMAMSYHVLSVDGEGTASARVDLNGKPALLVRARQDGTIVDARPLSPEATGLEAWVGMGLKTDRAVHVGDAIPFRQRIPNAAAAGLPQDTELVGTVVLRRFSRLGQCWAAHLQGGFRLDMPGGAMITDPDGSQFRLMGMTADVAWRAEVRTGAAVEMQLALVVAADALSVSPPVRSRVTLTSEMGLDPGSLKALGCS